MPQSRPLIPLIAAFSAIYLLWGSTYLAVALGLQSLPPLLLMAARCLVGGAVLSGYAWTTGTPMGGSKTWLTAAVCGIFFFVGCHGVLAYAQQYVPSGLAAVLLATIPLWITLLDMIAPANARPSWATVGFLVPGAAGVCLIVWREAGGSRAIPVFDVCLLLGASLSWAIGTVISERRSSSTSPVAFSGLELVCGGLVLLALSAARGELSHFDLFAVSAVSLAGWLYLTFAGTVVAFAAYIWLLKQVSPTVVATYTFVNPVIAAFLGWAFFHEVPTKWAIGGAILVIASVAGLLLTRESPQHSDEGYRPAEAGALGAHK